MGRQAKQGDELRIVETQLGYTCRIQIGKRRQTVFARTKGELRKEVARRVAAGYDVKAGLAAPERAVAPPQTIKEASERKIATYPHRASSKQTFEANLAPFLARFGERRLEQLGDLRYEIELWDIGLASGELAVRGKPLARRTRRHYLSAAERLLTYCDENDWLSGRSNPLRGIAKARGLDQDTLADDDKPDPFRSWEEFFRVAAAIEHPAWNRMVRFAAGLGLSPQEMICARACDIAYIEPSKRNDLQMGIFEVNRTWDDTLRAEVELAKNSTRQAPVALTPLAAQVIDELRTAGTVFGGDRADWRSSPLLFPDLLGELTSLDNFRRTVWKQALVSAGLHHRGLRQLRHTFGTLTLVHGGLEKIKLVSTAMRHSSVTTTERFYVSLVTELRAQAGSHVSAGMPLYEAPAPDASDAAETA